MSAQPVSTTAEDTTAPQPSAAAQATWPACGFNPNSNSNSNSNSNADTDTDTDTDTDSGARSGDSAAPSGRVALVTGANRGIGLEICRQLAAEGVRVLLSGRSPEAVTEAARRLASEGLDVEAVVLDVTDPRSIQAAADGIQQRHGRLDILVNNAAIRVEPYGRVPSQQSLALWHQTFATNLFGVVAVTQALLPLLRRSPAARIVNVSSLLASLGTHSDPASYAYSDMFKSLPAYSASKSAVNAWTVHLAYELRQTGIKVNAVHPGYTRTDMNDGAGELEPRQGALTSVRMALLGPDGPTGQYVHMGRQIPW